MSDLEKGKIYRLRYTQYKHDPHPLALILWVGDDRVHAINLNYLPNKLQDKVIAMIGMVCLKVVNNRSAYAFYHSFIKQNLPDVVRRAYRVYLIRHIKKRKKVSDGWNAKVFNRYKEISKLSGGEKKKAIRHIGAKLYDDNEIITEDIIEKRVRKYVNMMTMIASKLSSSDLSEYTFTNLRKKIRGDE